MPILLWSRSHHFPWWDVQSGKFYLRIYCDKERIFGQFYVFLPKGQNFAFRDIRPSKFGRSQNLLWKKRGCKLFRAVLSDGLHSLQIRFFSYLYYHTILRNFWLFFEKMRFYFQWSLHNFEQLLKYFQVGCELIGDELQWKFVHPDVDPSQNLILETSQLPTCPS